MGCCLSREDDRFNGGSEVLLPKGRNTNNKRVNKLEDGDLAKKKKSTNGSSNYKSPSAIVAARDAAVKVPVKSQLAKNVVENVDLLRHKPPTPSVDGNVVAVAFTSILGKTKDVDNDSNDDKSDDDKIGNDKEDDNDKAMENTKISKPKKIVSTKKSKKKRKKGKK
ncbi:unnamed protein product [Peronospora belbahrii]|uniref:Uncharacterized protein n=1 Tax=Peronospora belbahrii TaxID=622444 RepID=A0AAU9KZL7_9STRA|nr:unnamed protein product [Peronospora belbahrii]CAH0519447.1 unnamed protein product [Peronospora belbahrii]